MRIVFTLLLCVLGSHATAQSPTDDAELLNAEQRDARLREQQELEARTNDLESQQETTRKLLDQQAQYLDALRAQIEAIKQSSKTAASTQQKEMP